MGNFKICAELTGNAYPTRSIPLMPPRLRHQPVGRHDQYLPPNNAASGTKLGTNETPFLKREDLGTRFPGVYFSGDNIFIDEKVIIAPGAFIRAIGENGKSANIVIKGSTIIGSHVRLSGNIEIEASKLRPNSKITGDIKLINSRIDTGVAIVGHAIETLGSTIRGSISGNFIKLRYTTVSKGGGIVGNSVTAEARTKVNALVSGSNCKLDPNLKMTQK